MPRNLQWSFGGGGAYDLAVGALYNEAFLAHGPDRVRDFPLRWDLKIRVCGAGFVVNGLVCGAGFVGL